MGSNREKYNIAVAILEKLQFLKGNKDYFAILMVAIIFSSTIHTTLLCELSIWPTTLKIKIIKKSVII